MKNRYQPCFRKVRTSKPKINTDVDIGLHSHCFNSNIDDIENENYKNLLNIVRNNLKNQMNRKENLIFKRCLNCGEPGGLIFCNNEWN